MTVTPGLLRPYSMKRRAKAEDIPPQKCRPVVWWPVALDTAVTVPVGVSDPRYCGQRSSGSLCFSMSGGYTCGMREEVGKLVGQTGSTCRCDRAISFPLTSTSSRERPEWHPHSFLCPSGSRRQVRTSSSRPRKFLHRLWETPSSPCILRSKLVLDEFIHRKQSL